MSLEFVAASNEYLSLASAPITALPFTIACWFRTTTVATGQALGAIETTTTANKWMIRLASNAGQFRLFATQINSNSALTEAEVTVALSTNTWYHACGVFRTNSSRDAYLNGANKASNTTSGTGVTGVNRMKIGAYTLTGPTVTGYMQGRLAEFAIWNIGLSDTEVSLLGIYGYTPIMVRPDALVEYWPIIGELSPEPGIVGGNLMTLNGTPTIAAHPAVIYPPTIQTNYAPGATGGGGSRGRFPASLIGV